MTVELNSVEKAKVQAWLSSRARAGCPFCGQRNFEIGSLLTVTSSMEPTTGRIHYMHGYPLVSIFCNYCAHVMWFSAMAVGVGVGAKQGGS